MSRVVIIAVGSRGDVAPLTGVGVALQRAGHQVAVAAYTPFADMITSCGLAFRELPAEFQLAADVQPMKGLATFASPIGMRALGHDILTAVAEEPVDIVLLSPFAEKIFSVERVEPLVERARQRLKELGIRNVKLKYGDGMKGWPTQAPFDGILVAAAPLTLPETLVQQLAPGGRLIVPVGPEGQQQLLRITRRESGFHRETLGAVSFVPLLGGTS